MSARSRPPGSRRAKAPLGKSFTISTPHVLLFLLVLRIINALVVRTFFVPDEFYQSLEVAWDLAFGPNSGAWITWVS